MKIHGRFGNFTFVQCHMSPRTFYFTYKEILVSDTIKITFDHEK